MKQNNKNSSKQNKKYFAEIIESSIDNFIAQCWQWDFFPEFGSLIQVENQNCVTLCIVTQIQTGSMDPTHYPFPYQKTEDELMAEQPQIFEFLKTTFRANVVGYFLKNTNKIFYLLPSKPCKIHAFVNMCPESLYIKFFQNPDFLHLLFEFSTQIPNLTELLLAILNKLIIKNQLSNQKLDQFCQTFTLLTGNDYKRLKLFLKRVESIRTANN